MQNDNENNQDTPDSFSSIEPTTMEAAQRLVAQDEQLVTSPVQSTVIVEAPIQNSVFEPQSIPISTSVATPITTSATIVPVSVSTPVADGTSQSDQAFSQPPTFFTDAPITETPYVEPKPPISPKKRFIIIGSIIAGGLILLGGGSALAYNLWYQNPDKVVTEALVNTIVSRTSTVTGSINTKNKDYSVKVTFDAKTATDNAELQVKVEYTADGKTFKLDGAGQYSKEGDLYIKVNNIREAIKSLAADQSFDYSMFDSLITKVDGNWIKITSQDVGNFSEEYKKTQKCVEDVAGQIKTDKSLGKELLDLYQKNTFITVKDSLGSRNINGVGSLGYVVDLNTDKAKTFVSGLDGTQVGEKLKACDNSYDFNSIADGMSASEDDSNSTGTVELWASRFGHVLTEVNAKGTSDGTDVTVVLNPTFNKAVQIDTPKDSISIETLMAEIDKIYGQSYTNSSAQVSSTVLYN